MHPRRIPRALALMTLTALAFAARPATAEDLPRGAWPQFRGAGAAGVADGADLPSAWDVPANRGVRWKTPIAGLAHASPIVWGDHVFTLTAIADGMDAQLKIGLYGDGDSAYDSVEHVWKLICVERRSGKVLWERELHKGTPRFMRHTKATHANCTPATDGTSVIAMIASEGLYCCSMDGEIRWKKDLGELDVGPHDSTELQWGFASSPILVDGRVIVQCDVKKDPFLAAFDVKDGREIWRVRRDDLPGWSTPTALRTPAGTQILVNGCKHMGAYAWADGKEIWRMSGGGGIPVPAPVVVDGLIYLTSNHRPVRPTDPTKPIFVIKADARGELPVPKEGELGEHVAWMKTQRGNYMQTPLVYRGLAYFCNDNGSMTAYDARSGDEAFRERVGSGRTGFTASLVAGDGKIFCTSEEGDVFVLAAGREFKVISQNPLGEPCLATPAVSDGLLIFRTQKSLIAVGR